MVNMLIGMDLTILNQKFKTAYRKGNSYQEFMFTPDTTAPKGTPLTIKDMVSQINQLVLQLSGEAGDLSESDIQNKLTDQTLQDEKLLPTPDAGKSILDYIVVNIDQAFVYLKKYDKQQPSDTPTPDTPTPDEMSYAFQFSISFNNDFLPDFNLFKVNTVTFAIWNCTYQKVLEHMNIWDMSTYLQ